MVERVSAAGGRAVVMTYFNPVLRYGVDAFARDLAAAGGLGVITPDLIPDEADEWLAASDAHGLDRIFLVAPSSTEERIASTAAATRGFLYAASTMGVTGARDAVGDAAPLLVQRCRAHTTLPIGVGLGVRSGAQAAELAAFADGVIVGSAFVTAVEQGGAGGARALAAELAEGVRARGLPEPRPAGPAGTPAGAPPGRRTGAHPAGATVARVTAVAPVLAYIPSPPQGVWHLGPIPIRAYALCIIAGILIAVYWGEKRFVARGGQPGTVMDVAVFAVPFGLVGGRLYHVATDWQTYFGPGGDPLRALMIWEGGLGIWGAVALGGVGAWIGCRRRGVPLPFFADAVAPGIVVAQAVGRLGNYFNQELYGAPTTLPWGLEIYRRVDPATGMPDPLNGVALNPTPDRDRAAHVPLRADLEPAGRGPRRVGRPPVPAGPRPGVRRVRRGLHGGPVRHRADAHRLRHPRVRRHPHQRRGRGGGLRRRTGLPRRRAQTARGAGGARRGGAEPAAEHAEEAEPAVVLTKSEARRAGRGMTGFAGFGEGAVDFYDGLEADNSKAYWTDHRDVYENDVKAPMLALLAAWRPSSGLARSSGPTATCASRTTRPRTRRTAAPPRARTTCTSARTG